MKKYTTANYVPFNVRIVRRGECYGRNDCIKNAGTMPLVEFYDSRYPHTPRGQFVARYYLETFLWHNGALCLAGGIPAWNVDAETISRIQADIIADNL